jgi:hypothetical protein
MSGRRYDLYGWRDLSLDEAARRVERALSIRLEPRESTYRGGAYYAWDGDDGWPIAGELIVQANAPDDEGYLAEAEHPNHRTLLYASRVPDAWFEALSRTEGIELLASEVV